MENCEGCSKAYDEIKLLEVEMRDKYEIFKSQQTDYTIEKIQQKSLLKSIHTRIDDLEEDQKDLNHAVITHMKEEEHHHIAVATHMARTNQILENIPSKLDLEKQKGRIDTIWVIGGLTGTLIAVVFSSLKMTTTKNMIW